MQPIREKQRLLMTGTLIGTCLLMATPAGALGFGIGAELGGYAGYALSGPAEMPGLTQGTSDPSGGGGALGVSLTFELIDKTLFRLHGVGRLEGGLTAFNYPGGKGAAYHAGGDLLLRPTLSFPMVSIFADLGGGAGQGWSNLAPDNGGAVSSNEGLVPSMYLGLGATVSIPLMPYFELRLGTRRGLPQDDLATQVDGWLGRHEVFFGSGLRF